MDGGAARRDQYDVEVGMVGVNVPIPRTDGLLLVRRPEGVLFGDSHACSPEGVQFFTRGKIITSRWLEQPRQPRLPQLG